MSRNHIFRQGRADSNKYSKPCFHHARGKCAFGTRCKYSHNGVPTRGETSRGAQNTPRSNSNGHPPALDGKLQLWKQMLARASDQGGYRPTPTDVARFFSLALELMDGDVGAAQDAIKRLAEDPGLSFVRELSDRHTHTVQGGSSRLVLWTTEIRPLLQLITHPRVIDSAVLEHHLSIIFNFLYGVGGARIARLSSYVIPLVQNWPTSTTEPSKMEAIVLYLAALSKMMDCNTLAIVNAHFPHVISQFTTCLESGQPLQPADDFLRLQAAKYIDFMRKRIEVGDGMSSWQTPTKLHVAREDFVLKRDLPGHLSAQGPRHDNDNADISKIKILPTPSEIMSPRGEYLPTTDPSQWHIKGIEGRLDREFRLLREDTVGQLRDTVRETLEQIRKPKEERTRRAKNSVRTCTYNYATAVDIEFDRYHGLELVVRCQQPPAAQKLKPAARRDWWKWCKYLQAGALVCILDAKGMVLFCAVSDSTMRTADDKGARQKADNQDAATTESAPLTLAEDKDFLYVKLQLVEPEQREIGQALRWYRNIGSSLNHYLVEFPGVLLASFKHTLLTLQQMYQKLDVPFSDLLAPPDSLSAEIKLESAYYAKKPGFSFNLRCLTNDGKDFLVSPGNPPHPERLESRSSLDLTQSAALLNTLSREFSLIQGPPGTGKSYTGEKIIKVLLANKKSAQLGPILCVCYTNHALDQLLEHLLDEGVSRIIRMGSRSKSERLQQLNLRTIAKKEDRTKYEGWELYNKGMAIQKCVQEQNELFRNLAQFDSSTALKMFLKENYPLHHVELFGNNEDGWETVERKPENTINRWLGGGSSSDNRCRQIDGLEHASLSGMNQKERVIIHRHWLKSMRDPIIASITRLHGEYIQSKDEQDRIRSDVDLRCLQQADVIGVTTTGLARSSDLLRKLRCKVMLCEEAGEVQEAHILTALLPSVEHTILIGDHLQLRPQIQNYELQSTNPRGEQYSLDVSLFERLVEPPHDAPTIPFNILETQRRMHPSIAELVRSTLYPGLKDAESVVTYPNVVGMKRRLMWIHHEQFEAGAESQDPVNTSHSNDFEIEMATALVSHLVRQGAYSQGDIAVITPYLGQLHKLRRRMESMFEICVNDRDLEGLEALEAENEGMIPAPRPSVSKSTLLKSVRVATVDNFQGEEAKVIVISLVRSNPQNNCGFLSTSNRINVLLSRAKHGMYIIGDSNTCLKVPMWSNVIGMLQKTGAFGTSLELQCPRHAEKPILVSQPDHFLQLSPEGGCNLQCDKRLSCGHSCVKRCHSDVLHNAVKCLERCVRSIKGCDHPCPNVCGDSCPPKCLVVLNNVVATLPCGHSLSSPKCWEAQNVASVRCRVLVKRTVSGCNHEVTVPCHEDVGTNEYRCLAECRHNRRCGHSCKSPCYKCNTRKDGELKNENHGICQQICGRHQMTCRHNCSSVCHGDKPCQPCGQPCEVRCSHSKCAKLCHEPCAPCAEQECHSSCPHTQCTMPCAAPCDWVPCSKRCDKMLSCGHQCPSLCGEFCPDQTYCQQCGSDEIKGTQVDFLEMKEYSEIDLDQDPCIFPDCGHFLTVTSMDGQMDMSAHYEMDINGYPSKILGSSEPFSMDSMGVKICANCRGSLRNISRYGRIVRRAMLDEATKKFMAWSNTRYIALAEALLANQELLETTKAENVEGLLNNKSGNFTQAGSWIKLVNTLQGIVGSKRYGGIMKLRGVIQQFFRAVQKEEQPFQKVSELVDYANRHHRPNRMFRYDESIVQVKGHLLATGLLLKCDIVILGDFIRVCKDRPLGMNMQFDKTKPDLSTRLHDCETMLRLAKLTNYPREEVQSHIFSAQMYWFSHYFNSIKEPKTSNEDQNDDDNKADTGLIKSSQHHVDQARSLLEKYPSTMVLKDEIDAVDRMLKDGSYHPVTAEELRAVYKAMAREFLGTGHWYTCENGHPFTIGECGMAMEQALCPECRAPVGGRNHQATDGVRRATEIEELGREVEGLAL